MNLLAKLPAIAAYIYRMKYKGDTFIAPDPKLDWGGNFAHMMGMTQPYDDVARMYFILHSDHESGNVSAHTTHLVASALSATPTTPSRPASTAWPARSTASPTRRCWAGSRT